MHLKQRLVAGLAMPAVIAATAVLSAPVASAASNRAELSSSQVTPMATGNCPDTFLDYSYPSPRFALVSVAPGVAPKQNPNYIYGLYTNTNYQKQYRICGPR